MGRKITFVFLFVIFSITNHTFSAIFWYFKTKSCIDEYTNSRKASFHRGLLLSYSTVQKQLLCEDLFSAQLYVVPKSTNSEESAKELITDGKETEGEHQHALIVSEMSLTGEKFNVEKKDEIFIKCFGTQFRQRKPINSGEFYISYGFQYGRWLVSTWLEEHVNMEHIVLGYNLEASPQHILMDQIQLEHQYWATRRTMQELADESPAYVSLIEEKNDLRALTKWQRAVLCASVLSSPIYREERLEYSTKWIFEHIDNLKYEEKAVTFTYNNHGNGNTVISDCIICKGFANGDDEKSKSADLGITSSYDNLSSVYIIIQHKQVNFLDKYFKKVAILMNVPRSVARDSLFKNYNDENVT